MGSSFFDEAREQSEVKTAIVTKYFWAWAKVIMAWPWTLMPSKHTAGIAVSTRGCAVDVGEAVLLTEGVEADDDTGLAGGRPAGLTPW